MNGVNEMSVDGEGRRASSLDQTREEIRELAAQAAALVEDYFAQVSELRVFPETSASQVAERLDTPLPEEGLPLERLMEDCRAIIGASRHNGHPRFFGYVASPSTPAGAYADLMASTLNANVTSWRSSPAATQLEKTVIRWLGSLTGYSEDARGLLTSGGSMANLNAILIAHRAKSFGPVAQQGLWQAGKPMTLYASDQVHMSIPKAADVLGLGRDYVRLVSSDADFRLNVRELRERIEADKRAGLKPFCVVASAGTVNTGAVDPLAEIARVALEHELWFHVDGAYGALGSLDQTKRHLFKWLERADSVSLDAHKWLYAPVGCGSLLFHNEEVARSAFRTGEADYIKVLEETDDESFAFWDYGIELSRRFRALKVWMMLSYYGAGRVAAAIREDNELAVYLSELVGASDDFELLAPVTLSICCFRYAPARMRQMLAQADAEVRERASGELNQLNARIMHLVQRGGRAYLSNATLNGDFALRVCITNFRTTRADIRRTLDILREAAQELVEEEKSSTS
ncbi:MAG TPA: pyridoxal-dependent decarboxylase [Pyrinomonadaceae bacterium]|jgi:glutamate/tyrosine decarboxylase-like PLP-dependent enzyme